MGASLRNRTTKKNEVRMPELAFFKGDEVHGSRHLRFFRVCGKLHSFDKITFARDP